MNYRFAFGMVLTVILPIAGCSKPVGTGPREKTIPVTGIVQVDGEPAEGIEVICNPESGSSAIKYSVTAMTDKAGKFTLGTYQGGDGLPEGTYALTFAWMEAGLPPKDKFKGAYADRKKSKFKVTIDAGEKTEPMDIELSTNPAK